VSAIKWAFKYKLEDVPHGKASVPVERIRSVRQLDGGPDTECKIQRNILKGILKTYNTVYTDQDSC